MRTTKACAWKNRSGQFKDKSTRVNLITFQLIFLARRRNHSYVPKTSTTATAKTNDWTNEMCAHKFPTIGWTHHTKKHNNVRARENESEREREWKWKTKTKRKKKCYIAMPIGDGMSICSNFVFMWRQSGKKTWSIARARVRILSIWGARTHTLHLGLCYCEVKRKFVEWNGLVGVVVASMQWETSVATTHDTNKEIWKRNTAKMKKTN